MDWINIVLSVIGIGLLVAIHELGHHLVALGTGMRVRRFSLGFGPALLRREHRGVSYTIGALPLGGFVDIVGMSPLEEGSELDERSFHRRPRWARALVLMAGPGFNYVLAFLLFVGLFWLGGLKQDLEFVVQEVMPASAALEAGLQAGDVVTEVGGERLNRGSSLPSKIGGAAGGPLALTVRRGGETLQVTTHPKGPPGEGKLGIRFEPRSVGPGSNYTLTEAVALGATTVAVSTVRILDDVARMVRPGEKVEVGGPVAIVSTLKQSASHSITDFLWMLATLSVMLGLFNLFPIPSLDGSKLLFLAAEGAARRDIPAKLQAYVQGVGFLLMISLLLLVTVGDVRRLLAPEKPGGPPPAAEPAPAQP